MKRNTWIWILGGGLLAAAVGLGLYFARPQPTRLRGDASDYAILPEDVPEGWTFLDQGILTPHDIAQEQLDPSAPVTASANLNNLVQLYYANYEPPATSEYLDLSLQVLLYQSDADAAAALASDNPGAEWESLPMAPLGDESRLWHYLNPDPDISQNLYRIDFRYLNGVASVSMIGTARVLPDHDEPLGYAKKILARMRSKATPKDLQQLEASRLPDLRTVLLTQEQLAELDQTLGGRWQVDPRLIPQWTPTENFDDAETRRVLRQLGRVTGYQMFLIKALTDAERRTSLPAGLFQQVTAYTRADLAQAALGIMQGLEAGNPITLPTAVGDEARAWVGIFESTQEDGTRETLAVSEIAFWVGNYIASIRLQSRPLTQAEYTLAQSENLQLALTLAQALAENLRTVEAQ